MRGKTFTGATAVFLLAFFFLPWFLVSLNGRILGQFSGYQLAVGVGAYALDGLNGRSTLFLVPLAALVILLAVLAAHFQSRTLFFAAVVNMVAALVGLAVLAEVWMTGVNSQNAALIFTPELGVWLTFLAFLAAVVGGALMLAEASRKGVIMTMSQKTSRVGDSEENTLLAKTAVLRQPVNAQAEEATIVKKPATRQSLYKLGVLADDPSIQAWLVVQTGDFTGAKFRILPPVRIGRDAGNDIVIEDSALSGFHAVVREQGGAFHIQDLNSTNGIYLENQTTHRWQRMPAVTLVNDMRLKMGRTIFQVVIEE